VSTPCIQSTVQSLKTSRFKTRILDKYNRKIIVRIFAGEQELALLEPFTQQSNGFVAAIEERGSGFSEKDILGNSRGLHFFSIMGHDRQSKSVRFLI